MIELNGKKYVELSSYDRGQQVGLFVGCLIGFVIGFTVGLWI